MTALAPETITRTEHASGRGKCPECASCNQQDPPACKGTHPDHQKVYKGMHPLCRICGHCILNGSKHLDTERDKYRAEYETKRGVFSNLLTD